MPSDRAASPELLEALHRDGLLPDAAFQRALALSCASPGPQRWRRFLDWLLLALGAALLLVGVILLVAFNWAALPAFAKLGLVGSLVAGAALGAWKLDLGALPGRLALTGAAVLVGPLLAIYGQTYQTGADPFQLFVAWAALTALWVAIARFPALWLIELVLVDTALALFWDQVVLADEWHSSTTEGSLLTLLTAVNTAAWLAWEVGAQRQVEWMQGRWLPRTLAVANLTCAFAASLGVLLGGPFRSAIPGEVGLALLVALVAAMLGYFHTVRRDLFMVAAALGAAMTAGTTFLGRVLFEGHGDLGAVFVLGLVVIAEVGAAAWWLRSRHRAWGQA